MLQRGRVRLHRPQVGVHAEQLAQAEQALFRANAGLRITPLRPTDGAEQHRVGAFAELARGGGQRIAVGVDGRAADQPLDEFKAAPKALRDGLKHAARGGRHFGADAVAGQQGDGGGALNAGRGSDVMRHGGLLRPRCGLTRSG